MQNKKRGTTGGARAWSVVLAACVITALLAGCATQSVSTQSAPVANVMARATAAKGDDVHVYMARTPDEERYRLVLSIPDQRMALLDGHNVIAQYAISTALKGVSEALDSEGTPRGLHVISEKLGDGQPIGMIFKGREPTGEISELNPTGTPPVVTRLFRLRGLEDANQTTHHRLIYLHGSPHEKLLGQPASGGCIRMSSDDVITLFDTISVGTSLTILEEALPNAIKTTIEREQRVAQQRHAVNTALAIGDARTSAVQAMCVGHMYGMNTIPQNYPAAQRWCELSAGKGSSSALVLLAEIQEYGKLGNPNLKKARDLYEQAAAQDHTYALKRAANMQESGTGGPQDLLAAKRNFERYFALSAAATATSKKTTDAANAASIRSQ